ncbi:hypothetical protein K435DRAFT_972591 [Dendrothele bispora CBS 962.96]|uniref:Uncharacterized protein n=1 Tax=Dendrothele bispora (strain CBS 962.96) TaxID=1314807 RepID=A0A4V4HBV4_DENBC|nr:hypothetical protein K435DRAFT_972591 [Dendrothele bispora CBS 962.96]
MARPVPQPEKDIGIWPSDDSGISVQITNYSEQSWMIKEWYSYYTKVGGDQQWQQYTLLPPHKGVKLPDGEVAGDQSIARSVRYNFVRDGFWPPWLDPGVAFKIVQVKNSDNEPERGFMVKASVRLVARNHLGLTESLEDGDLKKFYNDEKAWVPLIFPEVTTWVRPGSAPRVEIRPNATGGPAYHVQVDIG